MTQSKASPETMARLCEAVTTAQNRGWTLPDCVEKQWNAYIAETMPPLRSRAEVAEQTLDALQRYLRVSETSHDCSGTMGALWTHLEELGAEPTAPEPAPSADALVVTAYQRACLELGVYIALADSSRCASGRISFGEGRDWTGNHWSESHALKLYAATRNLAKGEPAEPNPLTDHDQDTREERPCGCEESDALKLRIERLVDAQKESRRLLRFAFDLAQQIVQALETTPDA